LGTFALSNGLSNRECHFQLRPAKISLQFCSVSLIEVKTTQSRI
jgi:hypothetical protein